MMRGRMMMMMMMNSP